MSAKTKHADNRKGGSKGDKMTDTPFREALRKAYIEGDGGQLQSIMEDYINGLASEYPAEDHAKELLEACEDALAGFDTWIHFYAPECCDKKAVLEARRRVNKGLLAYIADRTDKLQQVVTQARGGK